MKRAARVVAVLLSAQLVPVGLSAGEPWTEPELLDRLVGLSIRSPFLRQTAEDLLDGIGPRSSGTANGARAEELAASVYRRAGLPLVRSEALPVPVWQVERASLALVEPTAAPLHAVPLAFSGTTPPDGVTLPVVDAGHGRDGELDALAQSVEGAAVLVRTGPPDTATRPALAERCAAVVEAGAAALLVMTEVADRGPKARLVTAADQPGAVPAFGLASTSGAWLARLIASGRRPKVRLILEATTRAGQAHNVIADLPGRRAEEMVLVTAHLDSWAEAQGAVDNGSGCVVLWQAAKALVDQGQRPLRTIRFVSFMGNELGLLGSRAYIERHAAELASIRVMLDLDAVGEPEGFSTVLQPGLEPLLADLARRLSGLGLSTDVPDRMLPDSDQRPFLELGVPVVAVRSRLTPEAAIVPHGARDTFDRIDPGQLQCAAAVTTALVWTLANAEPLPSAHLAPEVVAEALGVVEAQRPESGSLTEEISPQP